MMEAWIWIVGITLSVNIFFRKRFTFRNDSVIVIGLGLWSFTAFYWPWEETKFFWAATFCLLDHYAKIVMTDVDLQDGYNFIAVFFTLSTVIKVEMETQSQLDKLWICVPLLSNFQFIRNPQWIKRAFAPARRALGPVSIILPLATSSLQILKIGFTKSIWRGILAWVVAGCTILAGFVLRPDNCQVLDLVRTVLGMNNFLDRNFKLGGLSDIAKVHGMFNIISFCTTLVIVVLGHAEMVVHNIALF